MYSVLDMLLCVALIVVATLLILFAYFLFNRYKSFQLFEELGIPGPKPHLLMGNAKDMESKSLMPIISIEKWKKAYGKVFGYYSGPLPTVVVHDVDLIKQIAIKDFGNFINRWVPAVPVGTGGNSLVRLQGQRWKDVRKTLTPAFSASKLRYLTPLVKKCVADFDEVLENVVAKRADLEIYDRIQRLTMDVIGESAFAMKINCQHVKNNRIYENYKVITQFGSRVSPIFIYFPILVKIFRFFIATKPIFKSIQEVAVNLKRVIKMRRSDKNSTKTMDMLQLMLDAADEEEKLSSNMKPLTDDEIISNCFVSILAGFESTASALAFATYLLSVHFEVQEKVYQEIISNIEDLSNVTYEDANKLSYLDQVIRETLRLYPPIYSTYRSCGQDYHLDGKKIPKGMKMEIPIYNIQNDPDVWPNPRVFDPERFSAENKAKIHPAAHIPFGIGPRSCIGMRFALLEIKIAMITLLIKYRLSKSELTKHPPEVYIPLINYVPKNGIFVKIERR